MSASKQKLASSAAGSKVSLKNSSASNSRSSSAKLNKVAESKLNLDAQVKPTGISRKNSLAASKSSLNARKGSNLTLERVPLVYKYQKSNTLVRQTENNENIEQTVEKQQQVLGEEELDFGNDDNTVSDPLLFSPPPETSQENPESSIETHWTVLNSAAIERKVLDNATIRANMLKSTDNFEFNSTRNSTANLRSQLSSEVDVSLQPFSPSEEQEKQVKLEMLRLEELEKLAKEQEEERAALQAAEQIKAEQMALERETLINRIKQLLQQKENLQLRNNTVQSNLAEYFEKKRGNEGEAQASANSDSDKTGAKFKLRYGFLLETVSDLGKQLQEQRDKDASVKLQYQNELQKKNQQYEEQKRELLSFRKKAALSSANSKTGSPLSEGAFHAFEQAEDKKNASVHVMRLENIKLRNLLRCQEDALNQKEELSGGVHLIDFEQLKIENQTYNEKIEERNEELVKLRKTINKVVHILTHVKEKLAFEQAQNDGSRDQLKQLDSRVTSQRDSLPLLKQERDILRSTTNNLRRKHGLVGHKNLLRDYENISDECSALEKACNALRSKHANISAELIVLKRKVQKVQAFRTFGDQNVVKNEC